MVRNVISQNVHLSKASYLISRIIDKTFFRSTTIDWEIYVLLIATGDINYDRCIVSNQKQIYRWGKKLFKMQKYRIQLKLQSMLILQLIIIYLFDLINLALNLQFLFIYLQNCISMTGINVCSIENK